MTNKGDDSKTIGPTRWFQWNLHLGFIHWTETRKKGLFNLTDIIVSEPKLCTAVSFTFLPEATFSGLPKACFNYTIESVSLYACLSVRLSVCLSVCPYKWNSYKQNFPIKKNRCWKESKPKLKLYIVRLTPIVLISYYLCSFQNLDCI